MYSGRHSNYVLPTKNIKWKRKLPTAKARSPESYWRNLEFLTNLGKHEFLSKQSNSSPKVLSYLLLTFSLLFIPLDHVL